MFNQIFSIETDGMGVMEVEKIILARNPTREESESLIRARMPAHMTLTQADLDRELEYVNFDFAGEFTCTIRWRWAAHHEGIMSINGWGKTALESWLHCLKRSAQIAGVEFERLMAKIALSLVMTASEVSEKYNLDESTARKMATLGRIPARQANRTWLLPTELVEDRWGHHDETS